MISTQIRIDDRKSFQKLKTTLHRRIVDAVDLSRAPGIGEDELRQQLRALAAHVCSREPANLPAEMRDAMVGEIMDEIYGFGPLEALLNDPQVSDVLVNGPDSVWVERKGQLEETNVRFADETHLLDLIHRLAARAGKRIDEASPLVEARLADGTQLNAVIAPLALRGPTLSLRRPRSPELSLGELVKTGMLVPDMSEFLASAVRARLNLLICGGNGAGKTTLLNALCRLIPRGERIATVERHAELALGQSDVVSLETRPAGAEGRDEIGPRELLKAGLRMRPDRVIVGDLSGGEAFELLEAMNTGYDGSMATVHANDALDGLERVALLMALGGCSLPTAAARQYVAAGVQLIVQVARLASGERRIMRIAELGRSLNGEYEIDDLFVYRISGFGDDGQAQGTFYATGYEPTCASRIAPRGDEIRPGLFVPRELTPEPTY